MKAILTALATANPHHCVTQKETYQFLTTHFPLESDERDLYRRLLLEGPMHGRYIGVDRNEEICSEDPDELTARFLRQGRRMAAEAARGALNRARLGPGDIDALVVNTCTGYACPGLSSYVAEDLALNRSVAVFDLAGMGCGAALPNLECAAGLIQGGTKKTTLSLAVEVCSATFFRGPDPDLIVSNSIFGDGAAAAVLQAPSAVPHGAALFELMDFESILQPDRREDLCYRHEGGRLRNVLGRAVPVIAARAVAQTVQKLLDRHGLTRDQIDWWAVHPGGTAVLERIAKTLNLPPAVLRFSYEVFQKYGNMSSPSVLFVLEHILRQGQPQPGDTGLLLAFGAGLTAFAALVTFL